MKTYCGNQLDVVTDAVTSKKRLLDINERKYYTFYSYVVKIIEKLNVLVKNNKKE